MSCTETSYVVATCKRLATLSHAAADRKHHFVIVPFRVVLVCPIHVSAIVASPLFDYPHKDGTFVEA